MKRLIASVAAALVLATAQPALAGDKGAPPSKPQPHTTQRHHQPRVYGAPIQPPLVTRVRGKRTHAQKVGAPETAAQKKAHVAAVRKRKANEEYRREHPASADGPR
jgi:hypothetical protein